MAMSNWDTLAFGPDGKPSTGEFELEGEPGTKLVIHKNWIYIEAPSMWRPGGDFIRPVIASIGAGEMSVAGFAIRADRQPTQDAIFVVARQQIWEPVYRNRYFAGIGCEAHLRGVPVGVLPTTAEAFWTWLAHATDFSEDPEFEAWVGKCVASGARRHNQGDAILAPALGEPPLAAATPPGEALLPIARQLTIETKKN